MVKGWLRKQGFFHETDFGTPQGGIISPLLANIALNGIEVSFGIDYRKRLANNKSGFRLTLQDYQKVDAKHPPRSMIRYADDFVVLCETEADAKLVSAELKDILLIRKLELSSEKTNIAHISEGFEFLGFHIIVRKMVMNSIGKRKEKFEGYKLLITPSNKSSSENYNILNSSSKSSTSLCKHLREII